MDIFNLIKKENDRQNNGLELIASENYVSKNILKAQGSILTNKYAEGYPNKRYYGGCKFIDMIEQEAINSACKLFECKFANVQPHSGSQANAEAYRALLPNGGKILAMQLNDGGHLTHGSSVSFSSHLYNFCFFPLNEKGFIDLKLVEKAIVENKPDVVLAGCSAYPHQIDFKGFKKLADKYGIKFVVDMAHIAGLVATGKHENPTKYADIVTSTTHKTLRGPRGGLILTNDEELYKKINKAVFPYYQGGPLEHIIAAKAICFKEAMSEKFKKYIDITIENTSACAEKLRSLGCAVSTSENHLFLLNTLDSFGLTGKEAQEKLEKIGITTNKNMLPGDKLSPAETSGLRIGFAALSTRGCKVQDAIEIAKIIYEFLSKKLSTTQAKERIAKIIKKLKDINNL